MSFSFRTVLASALLPVLAFTAITYNSCKTDKCKSERCAYGGICKDGNCICQSGYEGGQCETVTRNKFLGVWTVSETSSMTDQQRNYTISIAEGENITDVRIHNFYNLLTKDVYAFAHGDSLMIMGGQKIDGRIVLGYAYLDHDKNYRPNGKMIMRYAVKIDSSGAMDDYGLYPELHGQQSTAIK